jgi:hypothetical protein
VVQENPPETPRGETRPPGAFFRQARPRPTARKPAFSLCHSEQSEESNFVSHPVSTRELRIDAQIALDSSLRSK